jgi:hypothetical protein
MANYNSGVFYNKKANAGGALYNSATYVITFRLNDFFNAGDAVTRLLAISVIYETPRLSDAIMLSTRYMLTDELEFAQDQIRSYALFRVADALRITDAVSAMICSLMVTDRFKMLDSVSRLATLLQATESVKLNEITSVRALIRTIDSFGLSDLAEFIKAVIAIRDTAYASDTDPKTAIADYIIGDPAQVGEGDLDAAFDWIMPFGLMMDWSQSVIPRAPEAESDEIQIAGVSGETLEHTRYRNRQFKVVAWSDDDLTQAEKDALVRQITLILDATKDESKTLTFARTGVSFDVKYDGELAVEEGPSFVRAIIPLTASAYGYNRFEKQVNGSGLIQNAGMAPVGVINRISGECENPEFAMGDIDILWTGTVPAGNYLYIDHGKEVCYLEDSFGNKTNVRQYLSGEFVKIPVGGTIIITANDCTEAHIATTWFDRFLW